MVETSNQLIEPVLNLILCGPPGTGKTYATVEAALEIMDQTILAEHRHDRAVLKRRFDECVANGDVRFVTFHQSFTYEDFVEGLRADRDEAGQLKYVIEDGIFKRLCESAAAKVTRRVDAPFDITGRRTWKMSLGNTLGSDAYIYEECIANNYVLLGWGGAIDFSDCKYKEEIVQRFHAAGKQVPEDAYSVSAVAAFVLKMKVGDLIVVSDGNLKFRAIGEIVGEYRHIDRDVEGEDQYSQCRNVRWLRVYEPSLPFEQLMHNQFSQMSLYELKPSSIDLQKLSDLLGSSNANIVRTGGMQAFMVGQKFGSGYEVVYATPDLVELKKPNGRRLPIGLSIIKTLADYVRRNQLAVDDIKQKRVFQKVPNTQLEPQIVNGYENILPALVEHFLEAARDPPHVRQSPKVLIIDEINRGNISRIFGELITLIEPTKRAGAAEALEVLLPYSKKKFSVPSNVYIIGTMNTADRSLTGLDVALRRRFVFREISPQPEILRGVDILGLDVERLLAVLNDRIEALLDREHRLGHAYFIPLIDEPTIERLSFIFRRQILPLLEEYFFEDWAKIQLVLNDRRKLPENQFLHKVGSNAVTLFGEQVLDGMLNERWEINEGAFGRPAAYLGIVDADAKTVQSPSYRQIIYGDLTIKQLQDGPIEVWKDDERLENAKKYLRPIAAKLGLETMHPSGNEHNTQYMGKRIIDALQKASK